MIAVRALALVFASGCGGSSPEPAPPTSPGDTRCQQAVDHMDQLAEMKAPDQVQVARVPGAPPAPPEDPTMIDCSKRWTSRVVDCVLAATTTAAANACIPAS